MHTVLQRSTKQQQLGFSLIELMTGVAIGLIVTLIIGKVLSQFESTRRTTSATSDAQTNGAIALYQISRDLQFAGYGLPVYTSNNEPNALKCPVNIISRRGALATNTRLSPVEIEEGGANGNDTVVIRKGNSNMGGAPSSILNVSGTTVDVSNAMAFKDPFNTADVNLALLMRDTATTGCALTRVNSITLENPPTTPKPRLTLSNIEITGGDAPLPNQSRIAFLGTWSETKYCVTGAASCAAAGIATNQLNQVVGTNVTPVVGSIVAMQAQYGVSDLPEKNEVSEWKDATGMWAPASITVGDRNRIKAVRIAVVARSALPESKNVTMVAPVSWAGGPAITLTANPNWQRYRYRVYTTVVPVRVSVLASKDLK